MNTTDVKKIYDKTRINDQFKYYLFLSVFYAILIITAQSVAYRLIQIGPILEPGGIFIFPAAFAISDVISEVYGPTLARRSIYVALFAQAFYSFIPAMINTLPYPASWYNHAAYSIVFNSSWLVFLSNLMAVLIGMVFNTQLIGKTKIIARGKLFFLRSFGATVIGEFILTAIIVLIALVPVFGFSVGKELFFNMFLFKVGISALLLYPANVLVVIFKKLDRVDIYETKVTLNPATAIFKKNSPNENNVINMFGNVVSNKISN